MTIRPLPTIFPLSLTDAPYLLMAFPDTFIWGAATSAYQIEGSPLADGAGPSIWHRFDHTPGTIHNGDTGLVACDHYHRYRDDVALMAALGLQSYRFSIAWGRVLPEGTGAVNTAGLGFYDRLVDALLEHGITPFVTLYHWDLPAALDERGGWVNRDSADWFAEYTALVVQALGDRVPRWVTLNEPWVVMDGGYAHGGLAPGHRNAYEAARVSHNLLRAHAMGVQAARAEGAGEVGLVVNLEPKYPASDEPHDIAALQRAHAWMNRQYLDPVFRGIYPAELHEIFGEAWPEIPAADLDLIQTPIDFLGINYYTRSVTCHDPDNWPVHDGRVRQPQGTYTMMDWEVYPQGLTDILVWVHEQHGPLPLYITENGAAFYDPPVAREGRVHDPLRIDYYRAHLRAIHTAMAQGVDLRGYYAWSLLDNFEWAHGYSKRFGLVHVDYDTLARTPKDSALFYQEVIESNGAVVFEADT